MRHGQVDFRRGKPGGVVFDSIDGDIVARYKSRRDLDAGVKLIGLPWIVLYQHLEVRTAIHHLLDDFRRGIGGKQHRSCQW